VTVSGISLVLQITINTSPGIISTQIAYASQCLIT